MVVAVTVVSELQQASNVGVTRGYPSTTWHETDYSGGNNSIARLLQCISNSKCKKGVFGTKGKCDFRFHVAVSSIALHPAR